MRLLLGITLLFVCLPGLAPAITADEYKTRRADLRKTLDGTMVLFGKNEGGDDPYGFVQEANFYYLTGWTDPGAKLVLTKSREILFLAHHNTRREIFTGKRGAPEDANIRQVTGFNEVMGIEKFDGVLRQVFDEAEPIYTLSAQPEAERLKDRLLAERTVSEAAPLIAKLRVKKSEAELAAIQRATDVTIAGHRAAWSRIGAGMFEYQLAASVTNAYLENGCERHAYDPIVGSGPNGAILHYGANKRRMDQGELVVMDTAAECSEYASDVTRTIPVNGKFTARQRELYLIVLGAQKAAIAAVKPGATLGGPDGGIQKLVKEYFATHGKDLHGKPLDTYFTHGIGHQVGLQVHDANTRGPLEAGMVVTIEPGLYIPEENLGIRIEDVVLVTENGAKVLSAALPTDPDEIEKALSVVSSSKPVH